MNNLINILNQEDLWSALLSEEKEKIINFRNGLEPTEFAFIIDHLKKMTTEDGWHPSQKRSASFALDILDKK